MAEFEFLWPGGPVFRQAEGCFKICTDSVLLADFAAKFRAKKSLDLGCGAGVIPIIMAAADENGSFEGLEIQEDSANLARENVSKNGLDARVNITLGDIRDHRSLYAAGSFDRVVSNPPYFAEGSGYTSPDENRAKARDERSCTLSDLCTAASYLCRWGGAFHIVHRPERLSELFCELTKNGLEPKRLRLVLPRDGAAPNLVLVEARRGGKPGLTIEPALVLCKPDGSDSDEVRKLYHR